MQVTQLFIHPLKSAAGMSVDSIDIEPRGPRNDRRWMLVDQAGRFVSGRELSSLVLLQADATDTGLRLGWKDEFIDVAAPTQDARRVEVSLWDDQFEAALADASAHDWLSQRLGQELRLVHMNGAVHRPLARGFVDGEREVSFADGFPLLLISEMAITELNTRAGGGIDARRFRPNIVVSGCDAHAEDGWTRLRIGSIELLNVKPCVRCVFTTVDADRGERDARGEPLRSLKDYRRSPRGITFGVNLVALSDGQIRLGDPVQVLD